MDVYSFFSEMGELETRYGLWLLEAVGAGGTKADITWDQYLEVSGGEITRRTVARVLIKL